MVDVFGNTNSALVVSLIAAVDCMKGHGKLNLAGNAAGLFFQVAAGAGVILTAVREVSNFFTA